MQQHRIFAYLFWIFIPILWAGCSSGETESESTSASNSSTQFETTTQADYAEGFRISYQGNYKLLEILNPYQDRTDTLRYLLVAEGETPDTTIADAQTVEVPVQSIIATSTTHLGLTEMLDAHEIIDGMVGSDYVYTKEIREGIDKGDITTFPEGEFNKEEALALGPDLIMVSGGQSSQFDDYEVLMDSDIDVLLNSEWLETTPLGKAEWVKVLGALLNKEELANEKFEAVAQEYNRLKKLTENVDKKPLVITNMPHKGDWYVPGGGSFTARYLEDAGAEYPWSDNSETGGLRRGFESVYEQGLQADIWINPGETTTIEEILGSDRRFEDFKPVQEGDIYNNTRRTNDSGGNDYWESGVIYPDRLLADYIHIFHPDILPDHEFYYYEKVESDE